MKLENLIFAAVFALAAAGGGFWIYGNANPIPVDPEDVKKADEEKDIITGPPISETGPWPTLRADELVYDFGRMEAGTEDNHVFTVHNDGEAPLVLKKGKVSCHCTHFEILHLTVPPGGSTPVHFAWHAEVGSGSDNFTETGVIMSNDPENSRIQLTLTGITATPYDLVPDYSWDFGVMAEGQSPQSLEGAIGSQLYDDFEVLRIESTAPEYLTAELTPLDTAHNYRSGYKIKATLNSNFPVGAFQGHIKFYINALDGATLSIHVIAQRQGPIRIIPTSGVSWIAGINLLRMGQFNAADGRKAGLVLVVTGLEEETHLAIEKVTSDLKLLELSLSPIGDTSSTVSSGGRRYMLNVNVPPGAPPMARQALKAVHVKIRTNHPTMPELKMRVEFVTI